MRFLFTLIFFALGLLASGTTYYIDPKGSNNNDGSTDHPWLTLSYACSRTTISGDIIHINAGTYIETEQSLLAVGVSIEGDGITSVIISEITASLTPTIYGYSPSVVSGNQSISNIKMDGKDNTAWSAIRFVGRSNITVHDCTIQNFYSEGLGIHNTSSLSTIPTIWITGCEVYDNEIINSTCHTGIGSPAAFCGDISISGIDGILIHNNNLTSCARAGSLKEGECIGASKYWKNCKIYNNNLQVTVHQTDYFDMAMEMFHSMGGNEIYNNVIEGGCIDLCWNYCPSSSSYSIDIHDNIIGTDTLLNYAVWGVALETNSSDVVIRNNHIKNVAFPVGLTVGYPEFGEDSETIKNINIYYNIFENCGSTLDSWGLGITMGRSNERSPSILFFDNINIWNNIITSVTTLPIFAGVLLPNFATATNINICNNIIQGFNQCPVWLRNYHYEPGASITGLSVENNIFYNNRQNSPKYEIDIISNEIRQNNLTNSPLFVSSSDFHLMAGSAAIDAGKNVGLPYFGTAPDIGAFETSDGEIHLNQPPIVSIISPTKGNSYKAPATVSIDIEATDQDGTISKVELFNGAIKIGERTTAPFSFTLKDLPEGSYSLKAVATDNLESTGTSLALEVQVSSYNETREYFNLYPNPNDGRFSINFTSPLVAENYTITIFNLIGRTVYREELSKDNNVRQFDLSHLNPGIYIVTITTNEILLTQKFIKG
jgi:hypothetical protein